jgi:hypothetical protein
MNHAAQTTQSRASPFAWPWYPFVVAIFPLWFIYASNVGQVSVMSAAAATAIALTLVAALYFLASRLCGSVHVAALATSVVILAFFAYGALHVQAIRLTTDPPFSPWFSAVPAPFTRHVILTPTMLLITGALLYYVTRKLRAKAERLTGACNVAAVTLSAMLLFRLGNALWQDHAAQIEPSFADSTAGNPVSVLGYNPDIYYIIVDGYARADVLREHYDFDNSEFLASLAQRGFAVSDHSRTNYYWTFLSLASSLNYDYLQDMAAPMFADPEFVQLRNGFDQMSRFAQDNRASHFLRSRGYRFVHVRSSAPPTERNRYADEEVSCEGGVFDDEYFRTLSEVTWLKAAGSLASIDLAECHKARLVSVANQARRPGSKFVFAHFLPPHHPYLFDRDGNILKHVTISNQFDFQARLWEDKHGYLEQLRFTNRSLLELVDRILAESERPPVIIVQSDHGPNLLGGLSKDQAKAVRFANFAAYLLPGAPDGVIPEDCAPVNQFRYLFNHYFDARLSILPQRNYFSTYGAPLKFHEITEIKPIGNES